MEMEVAFFDTSFLTDLLGGQPEPGMKIEIPGGAVLTFVGHESRRGALPGVPDIAKFSVSFGLGVSTSVVANWLYEKFKRTGNTLRVRKTRVEITPDGIVRIIQQHLER